MELRRLSYCSVRSPSLTEDELVEGLIVPAVAWNKKHGVTGCLYCGQRSFVQVIEGERNTVNLLMEKIVNDPRHSQMNMMMDGAARVRLFDSWSLKFVRGDGRVEHAQVESLAEQIALRLPKPVPKAHGPGQRAASRMAKIVVTLVGAEPTII